MLALPVSIKMLLFAACIFLPTDQFVGQEQPGSPLFDIASVRPSAKDGGRTIMEAIPGSLTLKNVSVRRVLIIAFDIQDDQLVGFPSWVGDEHYDIEAKIASAPTVKEMEGPMLQRLLIDRFALKFHHEERQRNVYRLIGVTKLKMRLWDQEECVPYLVGAAPVRDDQAHGRKYCGLHFESGGSLKKLEGKGVTMNELAGTLSRSYAAGLGRMIVDGVNTEERFDFTLIWSDEERSGGNPDGSADTSSDQHVPLRTALKEQLGLTLIPAKEPVDTIVIDDIKKPSEN